MTQMALPAALAAALVFAGVAAEPVRPAADTAPVVLELFTSQGCSSCPPADALLRELNAREGVIALSFHVDYWDYLGWKDPFSRPEWTARQRSYARLLGDDRVYTPELVVNGRDGFVGSSRTQAAKAIESAAGRRAGATLAVQIAKNEATITATRTESAAALRVDAFVVESGLATQITAGENDGRDLAEDAVVRAQLPVGTLAAGAASLTKHVTLEPRRGARALIVLAADAGTGEIVAATKHLLE